MLCESYRAYTRSAHRLSTDDAPMRVHMRHACREFARTLARVQRGSIARSVNSWLLMACSVPVLQRAEITR
jgi:Tat protein secretion system quality control protein TatD with DNase activity